VNPAEGPLWSGSWAGDDPLPQQTYSTNYFLCIAKRQKSQ
jgi:hypothetical protein